MKSFKLNSKSSMLVAGFCLISILAIGQQACKESYNTALGRYNNRQYDYVPGALNSCVADIRYQIDDYRNNRNGRSMYVAYKVYKLLVNSYSYIDRDNIARQKIDELIQISGFSRDVIQKGINNADLNPM
jgi:hypothetical protein